ncbi:uncharacterized protein LOC122624281 [Drosophila teissieri]|uniref:uncharacterized protein LOC122624281 n=1 Tax=Drosophila teissieri TaxID=7243 RepID=UPI001CBA39E1|nr:uncharacterized protein LOC122624281 [Drosophila teissieri]
MTSSSSCPPRLSSCSYSYSYSSLLRFKVECLESKLEGFQKSEFRLLGPEETSSNLRFHSRGNSTENCRLQLEIIEAAAASREFLIIPDHQLRQGICHPLYSA